MIRVWKIFYMPNRESVLGNWAIGQLGNWAIVRRSVMAKGLFLAMFVQIAQTVYGLGWTDICAFGIVPTCYIWIGNPVPFNELSSILASPVCTNGCLLNINPFLGACSSFSTCSVLPATTEMASFLLDNPITIAANNITIQSMSATTPVQFQIGNDNALQIGGANVNLAQLQFTGPGERNNLPVSNMATIVNTGGGSVHYSAVTSNSPYTVALFVGMPFLVLTVDGVLFSNVDPNSNPDQNPAINGVPVVILQASFVLLVCSNMPVNSVFLHVNGISNGEPSMPCVQDLNLTLFTQIAAVPAFPTCPVPNTIQLYQNCPNPAIFATLVTLLSLLAAALVIPVLFNLTEKAQRKLHASAVGENSQNTNEMK